MAGFVVVVFTLQKVLGSSVLLMGGTSKLRCLQRIRSDRNDVQGLTACINTN